MLSSTLLALALVAPGCSEYELSGGNDNLGNLGNDAVPDIEVDPTSIDFGRVSAADGVEGQIVTIRNVGEADLHLDFIELDDPEAPYTFTAVSSPLIPPEGSTEFVVSFDPATAVATPAKILIHSDDPDEPTAWVDLLGEGIAPVIDVQPEEYDFGSMYVGCDSSVELTISNIGNDVLVVDGFEFNPSSPDIAFDDSVTLNGALPWQIQPNEAVKVWVDYAPLDTRQDTAWLYINSNDPYTPSKLAKQTGLADIFGEATDYFEQPLKGETDILFGLDWSCSMYDDIANVENNFTAFIATLATMEADYHVAAVTADSGCINGSSPYIDNKMSEAEQQAIFSTMVNGSYGSNTERIFTLFEAALKVSNVGSGGCNEGFYRDDAKLNLVSVSDEPEQSVNSYTYYVTLFQALKDDPDEVIMHAIAGDYPHGCGSNGYGAGYYEASLATGGLFLSICATDFAAHLEVLAEGAATDLSSFVLSQTPVPETIVVKVNSLTVTTGWSFDSGANAVKFDPDNVPYGGSTIQVDYVVAGTCEG